MNAKSWILMRNKSRIQTMGMKYSRSNAGKQKGAEFRNEMFRKKIEVQSLLGQQKYFKCFCHLKRMDETRIPRSAFKLKFKGKKPMG
jgi:hypothetical protein